MYQCAVWLKKMSELEVNQKFIHDSLKILSCLLAVGLSYYHNTDFVKSQASFRLLWIQNNSKKNREAFKKMVSLEK